ESSYYGNFNVAGLNKSLITYLATAFGVKRSLIKNHLIEIFPFLIDLAVTQNFHLGLKEIVANKTRDTLIIVYDYPITGLLISRFSRAVFLLFELGFKLLFIKRFLFFREDQAR